MVLAGNVDHVLVALLASAGPQDVRTSLGQAGFEHFQQFGQVVQRTQTSPSTLLSNGVSISGIRH